MEELGNNFNMFLEQVHLLNNQVVAGQMQKESFLQQLKDLLNHYSDLRPEDYKDYINSEYYTELLDKLRSPEEVALWNKIERNPTNTLEEVEGAMTQVLEYLHKYALGPKYNDALEKKNQLQTKRGQLMEEGDWNVLDKTTYQSLSDYFKKYPNTVHKGELDDMMWNLIDHNSEEELNRYLKDWKRTGGLHVTEAESTVAGYREWENLKFSDDVLQISGFLKKYANHPLVGEAMDRRALLKRKTLDEMVNNPSKYNENDLEQLVNAGIFSKEELVESGLVYGDYDTKYPLPSLKQFSANPNFEAASECTDVYLFGVPGTGKTCLLMGLTGAEGHGYTINFKSKGGPYASALQQYVRAGRVPDGTPGKYVTTINSKIEERREKQVILNHDINFVEMSGEEFAHKMANNDETASLKDMGDGAMHLLRNDNRKVFFIIVDPTVDVVKFTFDEDQYDVNGNRIGTVAKTEFIDQSACISKFVSIFEMDENREFMKKVDAIHFIVTKADTLGRNDDERKQRARDLLLDKYRGSIEQLIGFCRRSKRVNFATDYKPKAYPFSLGQFYVGGLFRYDKDGTMRIIDTLRHITAAQKENSFWDDLRDFLA